MCHIEIERKREIVIEYTQCTSNDIDDMFLAFNRGFSDYIIKFDITKERFVELFLHIEGNSTEYSFIARDGNKPVGIMLGGMKVYEGIKTLRCGTLAIDPLYRNQGIAQELFERHKALAIEQGCKQLFLEVIKGNDKAIKFYLKQGYEIKNDIFYYQLKDVTKLNYSLPDSIEIKLIDFDQAKSYYMTNDGSHINWQNDFDYQSHFESIRYVAAFKQDTCVGVLGINNAGKIFYIHVLDSHRLNGIGKSLVSYITNKINMTSINLSITKSDNLPCFLEKLGFSLQSLSQHEMYLYLDR